MREKQIKGSHVETLGPADLQTRIEELTNAGSLSPITPPDPSGDSFEKQFLQRDFTAYILPSGVSSIAPFTFAGCKDLNFIDLTQYEGDTPVEAIALITSFDVEGATVPSVVIGYGPKESEITPVFEFYKGDFLYWCSAPHETESGILLSGICTLFSRDEEHSPIWRRETVGVIPRTIFYDFLEDMATQQGTTVEALIEATVGLLWDNALSVINQLAELDPELFADDEIFFKSRFTTLITERVLYSENFIMISQIWCALLELYKHQFTEYVEPYRFRSYFIVDGKITHFDKVVSDELLSAIVNEEPLSEQVLSQLKVIVSYPFTMTEPESREVSTVQELDSFSGFKDGYEVAENVVVKISTGAKDVSYTECYYLSSEGKLDIPPFKEGKFYVITEDVIDFEEQIGDNI